jgi:hypothetical protein
MGSTTAWAQNPELGDVNYNANVQPVAVASTTTTTTTSVAASGTDHAAVVGHFGVGHFGVIDLPVALGTGNDNAGTLSAPTIGARYWLDERMAIEGALGLGYSSGSVTNKTGNTSTETNTPSLFGMALHAGLPLVFATSKHFAFEVIPELNFGFVSGSQSLAAGKVDLSGMLLQLGARVGAEIQFGFIDIPQLALQGTVGLHMSYQGRSASTTNNNVAVESSSSSFNFGTTMQGEPWDIFTGNIAAIYYF